MSFKSLLSRAVSDNAPTPFTRRHLGPVGGEQRAMLATLGLDSLDALAADVVPPAIRRDAFTPLWFALFGLTLFLGWLKPQ
ncbi:MAG: hypothetical protein JJU05_05080 [Verrucomicrobia bacterium]|nr:hypothetical protein [Verrucomicrobiota bacterium]